VSPGAFVVVVVVVPFLVFTHISFSFFPQVRFVYETFKKMRPGVPLMELHGQQKQQKRLGIFYDFCKKQSACLFATDVGGCFPLKKYVFLSDRQFDVPLTTQLPAGLIFRLLGGWFRLTAQRTQRHTFTELGELLDMSLKERLSSSCCPQRKRA